MRELENLKETILQEYPRLTLDSPFRFACRQGLPCFNDCCRDVNIFLTPYDIIRAKNHLGISSQEFLDEYTISPFDKNLKFPVILMKLGDDEDKRCQFNATAGCTIYENRPWACRMYPLGLAQSNEESGNIEGEFYFMLKEDVCLGHGEDNDYTVSSWIKDQGIAEYNELGEYFKDLTLHPFIQKGGKLPPQKIEMLYMVCYNLDKFRDFVFKTSFLDKFELDQSMIDVIKTDDVELLKFGYLWLRFSLFGEQTLKIKGSVEAASREKLKSQKKL
jgi:Fe-S-cluster containining protein